MGKKTVNTRKSYSQEFKIQAIELAKELGSQKAAEKLGMYLFLMVTIPLLLVTTLGIGVIRPIKSIE